uniref:Uncharacterized protein n=1 Tax=Daphnia galeata TaxID=27404 RepID=A0A8J2R9A6_9CRUS|nr:unnamed protein product [Daphnia galeata]
MSRQMSWPKHKIVKSPTADSSRYQGLGILADDLASRNKPPISLISSWVMEERMFTLAVRAPGHVNFVDKQHASFWASSAVTSWKEYLVLPEAGISNAHEGHILQLRDRTLWQTYRIGLDV